MEPWIWAIIFAVFLIVEFSTLEIVGIWFAIGSLVGMVISFFNAPLAVEIIVPIAVSFVLLLFTRRLVKKWFEAKLVKTNIDALEGKRTKLLSAITELENGSVKINGVVWTAICNQPIAEGEVVEITSIDGNKLVVKKVEVEKPLDK